MASVSQSPGTVAGTPLAQPVLTPLTASAVILVLTIEGGAEAVVQKYLHDMAGWNALTVEEQERVIGRAKLSNVEMDDEVKPRNSHVALNTIVEADGTERQILRENMPFGSLSARETGP